jgi:MFS family permease
VAGLLSAFGAGAVLGGLWVARGPGKGDHLLRATLAFGGAGCCLILLGALPHRFVAPGAFFAMGFLQATFAATMSGLVMAWAPPALRGRINAIYLVAIIGVTPFGNLAAGEVAQAIGPSGPRWVLGGEGAILILAALVSLSTRRREPLAGPRA